MTEMEQAPYTFLSNYLSLESQMQAKREKEECQQAKML